jgi:hypothetical protein
MPIQWKAKAAGEIVQRDWVIPIAEGDSVQSFTASAAGATIDASERSGETVTLTISAGTNGGTATFTLDATTVKGLEIDETAYLPIRATPNAFSYTVRDVCAFALRPIVGLGASATAAELDDAEEHLSDMLAMWAESGADLGVKLPAEANDILYIDDSHAIALKNNLRVHIAELYGAPISPLTVQVANRGLQRIKNSLLTEDRESAFF